MTKKEYRAAINLAMANAGLINKTGAMIRADEAGMVAQYLSTDVLRAVIDKKILFDEGPLRGSSIPLPPRWMRICDEELTDRILTESLGEPESD